MAAQVLAGIGTNGIELGKRQLTDNERGEIIDNLLEHASGLFTNEVKPAIENALNGIDKQFIAVLTIFSSLFSCCSSSRRTFSELRSKWTWKTLKGKLSFF